MCPAIKLCSFDLIWDALNGKFSGKHLTYEKLSLFSTGKTCLHWLMKMFFLALLDSDSIHSLQVEVFVKVGHILGQKSRVIVQRVVLVPGKGLVTPCECPAIISVKTLLLNALVLYQKTDLLHAMALATTRVPRLNSIGSPDVPMLILEMHPRNPRPSWTDDSWPPM